MAHEGADPDQHHGRAEAATLRGDFDGQPRHRDDDAIADHGQAEK